MLSISNITSPQARAILCMAIMLIAGFLVTRLTKKLRLPNVTGYLLAGMILGPYCLGVLSQSAIDAMSFLTDIAPALIAFGVGKYLKVSKLRDNFRRVLVITLCEALCAAVVVTFCMMGFFHYSWPFALLLGVIAAATAPTSTIMTIRQYKARGRFVNTLLQVIAIDNALAILAFSIAAVLVQAVSDGSGMRTLDILLPLLYNIILIAFGALGGLLLVRIITPARTIDHMLVLALAILLLIAGAGAWMNVSPLLACMVLGMVYVNLGGDKRLFKLVARFSPPILLMFFVLSGARLNLPSLATAGIAGIAYFLVRLAAKYGGAWLGATVSRAEPETRRYIGMALIPQAGVSIGLAALAQRILPEEAGMLLSTIILSSGLLYEIVGPACAKFALRRAGAFDRKPAEVPAEQQMTGALLEQFAEPGADSLADSEPFAVSERHRDEKKDREAVG
ncbi:MAG: cation:proton antiporter [Clostridiaceae bacterium]|nr:cation:proton antiporter [Clostridiales bacterium]MDD6877791.1 cation:proton antiporter [Clostridiaceae bacterium]MDY3070699.1 cation:proton antiporter [Eubacteriales bacterium]MDY5014539.1 cation:proton antiporter [Eubacteriales bacterium]